MENLINYKYYSEVIERHTSTIDEYEDYFSKNDEPITKIGLISKLATFSLRLLNIIASYSRGDSIEELRQQYSDTVNIMQEVWDKRVVKMHVGREQKEMDVYYLDKYIYMRWMLSLGALLEVPDEEFNILIALIKRDNIQDSLYDFLIRSREPYWGISETLNIQKPKNNIKNIIFEADPEKCQKMIKQYLEKEWLKTYKNFGLDKAHLEIEKGYYYGQWAFEVAAVVKIKGLDDSSFKDNQYYPARLVEN